MAENKIRKHWSEEDVRAMVREEMSSATMLGHVREIVRSEVYGAHNLWAGDTRSTTVIEQPKAPPRSGWWKKLFGSQW